VIAQGKTWHMTRTIGIGLAALAVALWVAAEIGRALAATPAGEAVTVEAIAGTWLRPEGATTGVLIVAGSGPTDRDGNSILGIKTDAYRQLAEGLAAVGIASLRFDKRGVGASRAGRDGRPFDEKDVTIHTYAEDAAALAAWIGKQPGIRSVAIVGHSEGGLLALLAARRQKVDKLVLLMSAGRPLSVILRQQFDRQPMPEALRDAIERAIGELEKGRDAGELKPPLDTLFRPSVQPFLKSVLAIDPAPLVKEQAAPILVIGGGGDLQIGRFDFNALVEARAGIRSRWEPRLTHTLKEVLDDDPGQTRGYSDPSLPVMPVVIEAVAGFLKE